jgi:L-alanine-DL-glutamate epimerase-like enolase superfamily enzyme
VKVSISPIRARLRAPFVSSRGSERSVSLVRLALADAGHGEAAALETGVDQIVAALEGCRGMLERSDGSEREQLVAAAALPQAAAAIDLALWDLAGRRVGRPVWQLLGGRGAPAVEVNATIAAADSNEAARLASRARRTGFRCLKVKVGVGDDAARLAAVRAAAGPGMAIRVDANGAWSVDDAAAALRALEPAGIELCEEPVSGLEAIAAVSAETSIPIAIDESSALPGALDRRACDAVCLKIARCGGISGVLDAARRARSVGYRVYLASTLDGPLGIAAALHAAAVVTPDFACGLATLPLFERRRRDPLPAVAGRIAGTSGAGLGDGLLDWYR